jgi:hypothetical protein
MQTDGIEVASVGNTIILHESCLIEAFNLKAAIQYNLKNCNYNRIIIKFKLFIYLFKLYYINKSLWCEGSSNRYASEI